MRGSQPLQRAVEREELRALLIKQALPLGLLVLIGWLIWNNAQAMDFAAVVAAFQSISASQWGLAAFGTIASFAAVARMEAVLHGFLETGLTRRASLVVGPAAVAIAQFAGFGLLTGTLARWRMAPQMGLAQAAKVTALLSLTFMGALGGLAALAVLIAGAEVPGARLFAVLGLLGVLITVAASVWKPRWLFGISLPPLSVVARIAGLTLFDTFAAAFALYVLLPPEISPSVFSFYAAFLLALACGLAGATPGGVGPFEFVLLLSLPALPEAQTLAAIMGYRLLYFLLPACIGLTLLLIGPKLRLAQPEKPQDLRPVTPEDRAVPRLALSFTAARAETGLLRQGEFDLLIGPQERAIALAARAGQSLIMFADPFRDTGEEAETLAALHRAAKPRGLVPSVYKCRARTALTARGMGWQALQISQEAVIDTARFALEGSERRQLRRFLRKAETAGVTVQEVSGTGVLSDLERIAQAWGRSAEARRGFSMGLFDPHYLMAQRVFAAFQDGRPIAFASFHENWREWVLDLMCGLPGVPAGTMHAVLTHAMQAAGDGGCPRVSLAAVPQIGARLPLPNTLRARAIKATGAPGLERFKSAFAPRWEPLYLVAPTRLGLGLACLDLVDRITRPRAKPSAAHKVYSNYEFD